MRTRNAIRLIAILLAFTTIAAAETPNSSSKGNPIVQVRSQVKATVEVKAALTGMRKTVPKPKSSAKKATPKKNDNSLENSKGKSTNTANVKANREWFRVAFVSHHINSNPI